MSAAISFDVQRWIREGKLDTNKPLMNHQRVIDDRFIVMAFDGPTPADRFDYHINTAAEFFYQFEGEMRCVIRESDGAFTDHVCGPGELFYIPPMVPHRNWRPPGSIGLVIHEQRRDGAEDVILWYCDECGNELHRFSYTFTQLKQNLDAHTRQFQRDEALRTCSSCGWVAPADRGSFSAKSEA
jgi:3-hydroxyanthranilate 3,4-dioxygenase